MAANDEFPRGWVLSQEAGPTGQPLLILPAIPGIAHVLTSFEFDLANLGAGAAASCEVEVTNGLVAIFTSGWAAVPASVGVGTITWTGQLATPVGSIMAITPTSANQAGYVSTLTIAGYEI